MLIIRNTQMDALKQPIMSQYEEKAVAYVKSDFPDEFERRGEAGVKDLVAHAVRDAQGYGMTSSADVTALLSLMIILGEDFDAEEDNAWMRDILQSKVIAPGEKTGMILEELTQDAGA
jgi:hypothetical protein